MMEQNSAIEYFERSLVNIPSCSGKKVEMKKLKDGQKERNDEQQVIRNNYLLSENMYPPPSRIAHRAALEDDDIVDQNNKCLNEFHCFI